MTPPPQKEYIITELMVDIVESECVKGGYRNMDCETCDFSPKTGYRKGCCNFGITDVTKLLRSRPAPSPQLTDDEENFRAEQIAAAFSDGYNTRKSEEAAHDTAIRNATLKNLHKSFKVSEPTGNETDYELGFRQGMTHAQCTINSLRTQEQP